MRIERVSRRSPWPLIGCGCAGLAMGVILILGISVILLLPALPGLAARVAGFTPKGETQAIFTGAPVSPPVIQDAVVPSSAVLEINQPNIGALPADQNFYSVTTGTTDTGMAVAAVTFTEANLLDICRQRTTLCSEANDQFRNVRLDLRPGGAVVYAEVSLPDLPVRQTVGVVLRLDATGRQFEIAGVDIGGQLFDVPPGTLSEQAAQIAANGNALLRQLELEAGGGVYRLNQVYIDDAAVTLILQ